MWGQGCLCRQGHEREREGDAGQARAAIAAL